MVQAGALGSHVGRLTLAMDSEQRRLVRFEVEHVKITNDLPESAPVATLLREQYAQLMPCAREIVGEFTERIEFYNLAYWYARFLKEHSGADIALLPRRSLYDEPASFAQDTVTLERILSYLHNRYLVLSTVTGADLLRFCAAEENRHRFHPLHHGPRPFSGDSFYTAGLSATFDVGTGTVNFDLCPDKTYRLLTPWPFALDDIRRHRHGLPARETVAAADPVPGLKLKEPVVLARTTWQLIEQEGLAGRLVFTRPFAEPRVDWAPWQTFYERQQVR